jgi:hypothetical protein
MDVAEAECTALTVTLQLLDVLEARGAQADAAAIPFSAIVFQDERREEWGGVGAEGEAEAEDEWSNGMDGAEADEVEVAMAVGVAALAAAVGGRAGNWFISAVCVSSSPSSVQALS